MLTIQGHPFRHCPSPTKENRIINIHTLIEIAYCRLAQTRHLYILRILLMMFSLPRVYFVPALFGGHGGNVPLEV